MMMDCGTRDPKDDGSMLAMVKRQGRAEVDIAMMLYSKGGVMLRHILLIPELELQLYLVLQSFHAKLHSEHPAYPRFCSG